MDEINNMNKKIEESNDKWVGKIRSLEESYERKIKELEERNSVLMKGI